MIVGEQAGNIWAIAIAPTLVSRDETEITCGTMGTDQNPTSSTPAPRHMARPLAVSISHRYGSAELKQQPGLSNSVCLVSEGAQHHWRRGVWMWPHRKNRGGRSSNARNVSGPSSLLLFSSPATGKGGGAA